MRERERDFVCEREIFCERESDLVSKSVCVREREREGERQTDRQTKVTCMLSVREIQIYLVCV